MRFSHVCISMHFIKTVALAANGEGFGHASRMVSMVQELHGSYKLVLYAPPAVERFVRGKLGIDLSAAVDFVPVPAFELCREGERVRYMKSIRRNLGLVASLPRLLVHLRRDMRARGLSCLVSDFEPISTLAATALGIPVLQVNHPGVVHKSHSIMPDAIMAKLTATLMMGRYDKRILVCFYDGDAGPVLRREIARQEPTCGEHIVVSVKREYRAEVLACLEDQPAGRVLVYPEANEKLPYEKALASCMAVITSAGHQTLSEAICLGKPVFAIPQRGQFEQRLNAIRLHECGWGSWSCLKGIEPKLQHFLALAKKGDFPHKPQNPWMRRYSNDCSAMLSMRIRDFIDGSEGKTAHPAAWAIARSAIDSAERAERTAG